MTMSIFVIFRASDPEKIKTALETEFPDDFLDTGQIVSF
jgi:hypothetical protein